MIEVIVKGKPVAWQRAGRNGKRSYTPAKTRAQEDLIRMTYKQQGGPLMEGAIEAEFEFIYEPPKSFSNRKRLSLMGKPKTTKPDMDNLVKLCQDALNQTAYTDDSRICKSTSTKIYGPEEMTIIRLKEASE